MISKKVKWIKIFNSLEELESKFITDNYCLKNVEVDLLLVKTKGEILAFKNRCPHQNKPLDGCKVKEGRVVCPYHQYTFSIEDGRGHGLYLEKYPIVVRTEGVFVGVEKWSFF